MRILRDHEKRYYYHKGEWYFSIGKDSYTRLRLHLTTPRHRFNFAIKTRGFRFWYEEAARLRKLNNDKLQDTR